jgi:hypothetical protein
VTIVDWCLDRIEPIYDRLADAYGLLNRFVECVIDGLEDMIRSVKR